MPERRPLHEVILELKMTRELRDRAVRRYDELIDELKPFIDSSEEFRTRTYAVADCEPIRFYVALGRICFEDAPEPPSYPPIESLDWPEPAPSEAFELPTETAVS